jgi:hypothetical protein
MDVMNASREPTKPLYSADHDRRLLISQLKPTNAVSNKGTGTTDIFEAIIELLHPFGAGIAWV